MDVTEIGGAQLIAMINALDPKYENERMNRARTALGLGYPTAVQMAFQNGYLDLGMDLKVLGLSQHIDVRGVPIYGQVSSATEGVLAKLTPRKDRSSSKNANGEDDENEQKR